ASACFKVKDIPEVGGAADGCAFPGGAFCVAPICGTGAGGRPCAACTLTDTCPRLKQCKPNNSTVEMVYLCVRFMDCLCGLIDSIVCSSPQNLASPTVAASDSDRIPPCGGQYPSSRQDHSANQRT